MANIGSRNKKPYKRFYYKLYGVTDESGANAIKEYLELQDSIYAASIDSGFKILSVDLLPNNPPWAIEDMVASIGYAAKEDTGNILGPGSMIEPLLLILTGLLTIISFTGNHYSFITGQLGELIGLFIVFICGYSILKKGMTSIFERDLGMSLLIAIITLSPLFYSYITGKPFYYASGIIVFIVLMGNILNRYFASRFDRMDFFLPSVALVKGDENESFVKIEDLKAGSIVTVKPGYKIPVDGVIEGGEGRVVPVGAYKENALDVVKGLNVNAGSAVISGPIQVKALKPGADSKWRRMAGVFNDARKSINVLKGYPKPIERTLLLVSVFGATFVFIAFNNISSAVAILLLAFPAALLLAKPLSLETGRLAAENAGVPINSHGSIEGMSITDTIVVNGIDPIIEDAKIVEISSMEKFTPEDVKAAIASYTGLENDITLKAARDFSAGIAKKEGYSLEKMAEASKKFQVPSGVHDKVKSFESDGKSVMFAMKGKELMGLVIFDLFVPERMSVALERLGKSGIKEIILLSAESTALSEAIAKKAGISTVRSRADDREKIDAIEKMVAEGKHVTVVSKGHDMSKFAGNSGAVSIDVPAYGFEGIEDARCSSFMEVPSLLSMAKGSVKRASQSMNFGFYFNTFAIIMASLGAVDAELAILMVMASVVLVATYSALPYISWKR